MFQFPTFPSIYYFTYIWITGLFSPAEFPHSDIHGLPDICSSPWLFAAYHVLLRLLVPRHSPYALSSLTYLQLKNFVLLRYTSLKSFSTYQCTVSNLFVRVPCITRFWIESKQLQKLFLGYFNLRFHISLFPLKSFLVLLVYLLFSLYIYIFFNVLI